MRIPLNQSGSYLLRRWGVGVQAQHVPHLEDDGRRSVRVIAHEDVAHLLLLHAPGTATAEMQFTPKQLTYNLLLIEE